MLVASAEILATTSIRTLRIRKQPTKQWNGNPSEEWKDNLYQTKIMEEKKSITECESLLREGGIKLIKEDKARLLENTGEDLPAKKKKGWCEIPKRYTLCFLVFLGFLLMNSERSCLSVAIVAMSSKRRTKVNGKWITKVTKFL